MPLKRNATILKMRKRRKRSSLWLRLLDWGNNMSEKPQDKRTKEQEVKGER